MVSSLNETLSNVQYKNKTKKLWRWSPWRWRWERRGESCSSAGSTREERVKSLRWICVWGILQIYIVAMILTSCIKVRYTKEGRGGVADEEVRFFLFIFIHFAAVIRSLSFFWIILICWKGVCLFDGLGQWCSCWIASGKNEKSWDLLTYVPRPT